MFPCWRFGLVCALAALATSTARAADATHVVILDDTLSMTDHWKAKGRDTNCFEEGKQQIKQLAAKAVAAKGEQRLVLLKLTGPKAPLFDGTLTDESLKKLQAALDGLKCTALHVGPLPGVEAAAGILAKAGKGPATLHFVSDFRTRNWAGDNAQPLHKAIDGLLRAGVDVHLVDTAQPARGKDKGAVLHHDDLAIVDLRPDSRVRLVPTDGAVAFTATLVNLGPECKDVLFDVSVDGEADLKAAQVLKTVKTGVQSVPFKLTFAKPGFVHVVASLGPAKTGVPLAATRHVVVEARKEFPVLLVDGNGKAGLKRGGDSYFLDQLFRLLKGYKVVTGSVEELGKPGLDKYPVVYLLNIRRLPDKKAIQNVENYVKAGGNVVFFLGDKVDPDYYNRFLHRGGKGLFPAKLADQPTKAPTDKEKLERMVSGQPMVHIRARTHPVCADLYETRILFSVLSIDRYFPVIRDKSKPLSGGVEELLCMPARGALADFKAEAQKLYPQLPVKDERYRDFEPGLKRHQWNIRKAIFAGKELHELADALDNLLEDRGDPDNDDKPDMTAFWARPEVRELRARVEALRDKTRFGDPLLIAARYGDGRVAAFLTSAGHSWNDWGGGPGSPTFVVLNVLLHKYLASGPTPYSLPVGTPLTVELDAAGYQAKMRASYQGEAAKEIKLEEHRGTVSNGRVAFTFDQTQLPGIYWLSIPRKDDKGALRRAYAINVDAAASFDLRRATRDELLRKPADAKGKITLDHQ
jgi:hypothetical protein